MAVVVDNLLLWLVQSGQSDLYWILVCREEDAEAWDDYEAGRLGNSVSWRRYVERVKMLSGRPREQLLERYREYLLSCAEGAAETGDGAAKALHMAMQLLTGG